MAKRFMLAVRKRRPYWWAQSPRSSADRLREAVQALEPDEALLVVEEPADGTSDPRRLKARLRYLLPRQRVTLVDDAERSGVWVYRPATTAFGRTVAIGSVKEAEVKSRPIDGDTIA